VKRDAKSGIGVRQCWVDGGNRESGRACAQDGADSRAMAAEPD
jgi:hypothetical protein